MASLPTKHRRIVACVVLSMHITLDFVICENILMFSHMGSHFQAMVNLGEELCERGYTVTIVSPSSCFSGRAYPFNIISYPVPEVKTDTQDAYMHLIGDAHAANLFRCSWANATNYGLLQNSEFILSSLRQYQFHIAIVDTVVTDALAFVVKLRLPYIMFVAYRFDFQFARYTDASLSPAYVPVGHQRNSFTHDMSFSQRAANLWNYFHQTAVINRKMLERKHLRDKYVPGMADFDKNVALRNTTLWIINSDFTLEFPYPVMPNVKYVGSLTAQPASSLPKVLEKFVNGSGEDGMFLVSFSSFYRAPDNDTIHKFLDAFSSFPQKVLWRGDTIQLESEKIKFMKWIPINDVLGSGKVRAFVSHGGINGVQEAMYHGVPMVILPTFGDQLDCATRVEARGYGVRLDPFDFTASSIVNALNAVVHGSRFPEKLQSVSEMIQFQHLRASGRETAAYWVEHAMKYGHNYIAPVKDLNYIQSNYIDVIGFAVVLGLFQLYLTYRIFWKIYARPR